MNSGDGPAASAGGAGGRPGPRPEDLRGWKLLRAFLRELARAEAGRATARSEADPRRKLRRGPYLALLLWGMFNPAVDSLRGLQAATRLGRLQREVGLDGPVSLGSLSEAQALVEPALLEEVLRGLAERARRQGGAPAGAAGRLLAADSTLWRVAPRMAWAVWRTQDGARQRAVRLHVRFHVWAGVAEGAAAGPGRVCERAAWERLAKGGDFWVADRYYCQDHAALGRLDAGGVTFLVRGRHDRPFAPQGEPQPLSDADRAAGVREDRWVRLGVRGDGPRVRRLELAPAAGRSEPLLLLTNAAPAALPGELASLLYRRRWEVELFFRWLKCLLGVRRFLCESERGVAAQLYLALVAAALLVLWTGRRPTKRQMEALRLLALGYATPREAAELVRRGAARPRDPPAA